MLAIIYVVIMASPFLSGKIVLTSDEINDLGPVVNGTMIYNKTASALQIYIDGWKTLANTTTIESLGNDLSTVQDNNTPNTTQISTLGNVVNCYHQTSFTNGGSAISGSWRTRTLNTIIPSGNGWSSISSNRLTLQPGRYIIEGWGVIFNAGEHMLAIYDETNATYIQYGPRMAGTTSSVHQKNYTIPISVNISVATRYELRHRCSITRADGYGQICSWSSVQRYCGFTVIKVE